MKYQGIVRYLLGAVLSLIGLENLVEVWAAICKNLASFLTSFSLVPLVQEGL